VSIVSSCQTLLLLFPVHCVATNCTHEPRAARHTENGCLLTSFQPLVAVAQQGGLTPEGLQDVHSRYRRLPSQEQGHRQGCTPWCTDAPHWHRHRRPESAPESCTSAPGKSLPCNFKNCQGCVVQDVVVLWKLLCVES
jgi:hypothetical protein